MYEKRLLHPKLVLNLSTIFFSPFALFSSEMDSNLWISRNRVGNNIILLPAAMHKILFLIFKFYQDTGQRIMRKRKLHYVLIWKNLRRVTPTRELLPNVPTIDDYDFVILNVVEYELLEFHSTGISWENNSDFIN